MKYRIKTLLMLIGIVAVLCASVPRYLCYKRWQGTRQQLVNWASRLERKSYKDETFVRMNLTLPNGASESYFVSTTQPIHEIDENGIETLTTTAESSRSPDPNRFYVVPPGKWVESIDEIILNWDLHRADAIKQ